MADELEVKVKSNGAYWQGWWIDDRGRKHVKSLGPKSRFNRRQARALARDHETELKRQRRAGATPRLSEWVEKYKKIRSDLAPASLALLDYASRYLTRFFDWDPPIDQITRAQASEYRVALAVGELGIDSATDRHTRPPKETTVCKHVRCVKRMFREAEDVYDIPNPFTKLRGTAAKPVKRWETITPADLKLILDACPQDGWRALFALCRYTGMRRGEALALRWRDVHLDTNRITVNADITHETTKKRVRVCPIEPELLPTGLAALLTGYLNAAPEGGSEFVCAGVLPASGGLGAIDRQAVEIIRKAGVKPYAKPFHTLRKNWMTTAAGKYPLHVLEEWCGNDREVAKAFYLAVDDSYYRAPPATPEGAGEAAVVKR